jgi:hypothetical protein
VARDCACAGALSPRAAIAVIAALDNNLLFTKSPTQVFVSPGRIPEFLTPWMQI